MNIDIIGILRASLHDIPKPLPRQVTSNSKKIINSFITNVHNTNQIPNLLQQLQQLHTVLHWTVQEYSVLEQIDQQFTSILL
jgi:hypothetical protein